MSRKKTIKEYCAENNINTFEVCAENVSKPEKTSHSRASCRVLWTLSRNISGFTNSYASYLSGDVPPTVGLSFNAHVDDLGQLSSVIKTVNKSSRLCTTTILEDRVKHGYDIIDAGWLFSDMIKAFILKPFANAHSLNKSVIKDYTESIYSDEHVSKDYIAYLKASVNAYVDIEVVNKLKRKYEIAAYGEVRSLQDDTDEMRFQSTSKFQCCVECFSYKGKLDPGTNKIHQEFNKKNITKYTNEFLRMNEDEFAANAIYLENCLRSIGLYSSAKVLLCLFRSIDRERLVKYFENAVFDRLSNSVCPDLLGIKNGKIFSIMVKEEGVRMYDVEDACINDFRTYLDIDTEVFLLKYVK